MKTYETLVIIDPDLEESEITKTVDSVQEIITTGGGNIIKVDTWGRRQLAYIIQKKREGYYVLIYFEAPPTLIVELNRRYKLAQSSIMRYLVVQLKKGQLEEMLESGTSSSGRLASVAESEQEYQYGEGRHFGEDEELVASTEG